MNQEAKIIEDQYGRQVKKLRISLTHRCNLGCFYCREYGKPRELKPEEMLAPVEIERLVGIAVSLGISRVKLTGGEPLLRPDVEKIVETLSGIPGVEDLSMTTNGTLLARSAESLRRKGLSRVTVSIDTLNEERFRQITSGGRIEDVLKGLEKALDTFEGVKVNLLALRGINDDEWEAFRDLAEKHDIEVRFIEYMPHARRIEEWKRYFVPIKRVKERLGITEDLTPQEGYGPAEVFPLPGGRGKVGFIAPVSAPFCSECDRMRLTCWGSLVPCLVEGGEVSLVRFLRPGPMEEFLVRAFREAAELKPLRHHLYRHIRMDEVGG